jgi:hypothetical protein
MFIWRGFIPANNPALGIPIPSPGTVQPCHVEATHTQPAQRSIGLLTKPAWGGQRRTPGTIPLRLLRGGKLGVIIVGTVHRDFALARLLRLNEIAVIVVDVVVLVPGVRSGSSVSLGRTAERFGICHERYTRSCIVPVTQFRGCGVEVLSALCIFAEHGNQGCVNVACPAVAHHGG